MILVRVLLDFYFYAPNIEAWFIVIKVKIGPFRLNAKLLEEWGQELNFCYIPKVGYLLAPVPVVPKRENFDITEFFKCEDGMYKEKLSYFEKKYEIGTQVFLKKFEGGELGDSEDFFEWFALAKAESHWVTKIKELKETSS